jgi:hypothetical protein
MMMTREAKEKVLTLYRCRAVERVDAQKAIGLLKAKIISLDREDDQPAVRKALAWEELERVTGRIISDAAWARIQGILKDEQQKPIEGDD